MPLRQVIAQVLKESPTPLSINEIMEAVKATGYQSNATNFRGVISMSLRTISCSKRPVAACIRFVQGRCLKNLTRPATSKSPSRTPPPLGRVEQRRGNVI